MASKRGRNYLTRILLQVSSLLQIEIDLRGSVAFAGFVLSLCAVEIAQNALADPWRQRANLTCFAASIFFIIMLVGHFDSAYGRVAAAGTALFCFIVLFLVYYDVGFMFLSAVIFPLSTDMSKRFARSMIDAQTAVA